MTSVSASFAGYAFNVVDRTCAAGNLSTRTSSATTWASPRPGQRQRQPGVLLAYGYQHPQGAVSHRHGVCLSERRLPARAALCQPVGELQRHADRHILAEHRTGAEQHRADVANFRQAVSGFVLVFLWAPRRSRLAAGLRHRR